MSSARSRSAASKDADVSPTNSPLKHQPILYLDLAGAGSSKTKKEKRLHVSKEQVKEELTPISPYPKVKHVAALKRSTTSNNEAGRSRSGRKSHQEQLLDESSPMMLSNSSGRHCSASPDKARNSSKAQRIRPSIRKPPSSPSNQFSSNILKSLYSPNQQLRIADRQSIQLSVASAHAGDGERPSKASVSHDYSPLHPKRRLAAKNDKLKKSSTHIATIDGSPTKIARRNNNDLKAKKSEFEQRKLSQQAYNEMSSFTVQE